MIINQPTKQGPFDKTQSDLSQKNNNHARHDERVTLVGIGASAGGLVAMQALFDALPADTGMAFIVVTHMNPQRDSLLHVFLEKRTTMPVQVVTQEVPIKPNHVYVISPNQHMFVRDSHLKIEEVTKSVELHTRIDFFFRSLAASSHAPVAVILSGAGSDGAAGAKAIKEAGGFLFVQDPTEAEFDSMPLAAINTNLVDMVLPVTELARRLVVHQLNKEDLEGTQTLATKDLNTTYRILAELLNRKGHDFNSYKLPTIINRIQQRMQLCNQKTLGDYFNFLRTTANEADELFNFLLIGVTNFFRDKKAWQALAEQVIPQLFEGKEEGDTVRIWSTGCATGEEVYSIAMLLLEQRAKDNYQGGIQIFATDVDEDALNKARAGFYDNLIETDVSPERLENFFVKENIGYRIRQEVRDLIFFSNHNILCDPPFSKVDLIISRNLLIYLNRGMQLGVFKVFYYSLNQEGFLFLGNSEIVDSTLDFFEVVDTKNCIYKCISGKHLNLPLMPLTVRTSLYPAQKTRLSIKSRAESMVRGATDFHAKMLEEYAPPSILIDEAFHIVHISETAGRYLRIPGGAITTNLFKLIRTEFTLELENAIPQAFEENRSVVSAPIDVQFSGSIRRVTFTVQPRLLRAGQTEIHEAGDRLALIFFLEDEKNIDSEKIQAQNHSVDRANTSEDQETIIQLEKEIWQLREQYNIARDELENINERYQFSTEELQANREEMQSINEEMQTVNNELKFKLDQVSHSESDLENLMVVTEIATLFLDRELKIQRYTPITTQLFNIRLGDQGRLISDLTHNLQYETLTEDSSEVLKTLLPIEREVQDVNGRWFLLRLRPYRSIYDQIDGVVLTFVDITALQVSEARFRSVSESGMISIAFFNTTGSIFDANDAFLNMLGFTRAELEGGKIRWDQLTPPEWMPRTREAVEGYKQTGRIEPYEKEYFRKSGERFWGLFTGRRIEGTNDGVSSILDITDRKRREANLAFLAEVSEDLIHLTNIDETMNALGAKISAHFNVADVIFAEMSADEQTVHVNHEWHRADFPKMKDSYATKDYLSPEFELLHRAGKIAIVHDTAQDERVDAHSYAALGIGAFVTVPLIRKDKWHFNFALLDPNPRAWRDDEIELMREIINRIWARLERVRTEIALHETSKNLANEVSALERLHEASNRLWRTADLHSGLEEILDATIALLGADMGNVQLLNPTTQMLEIAVQRGFQQDFLEFFREVSTEDNSACGRSLRTRSRIVIEDVEEDAEYAPYRSVAEAAGYRGVQSTPLFGWDNKPLGMLSTHFRHPHLPSQQELQRLDLYAHQATDFVERQRTTNAKK